MKPKIGRGWKLSPAERDDIVAGLAVLKMREKEKGKEANVDWISRLATLQQAFNNDDMEIIIKEKEVEW